MKFIPKSVPKISVSELSPTRKLAWGLSFTVFVLIIIVICSLFTGQQGRVEEALLVGQRLEIDLESGEIFGKILKTEEAKKGEKKVAEGKDKAEEKKEIAEDDEEFKEIDSGTKEKKEDELAWMEKDFIGPRLSEELLSLIVDEDVEDITVQRVNLSELSDKPIIVVIVKGLGLSASTTESALELPKNVTLGFSPYSPSIKDWVDKAKDSEHEIVLNVPMETKDYRMNDPGPYALITKSSKEDNITRLKMLLGLVKGYKAIYSEKEEIFTHTLSSSKPILASLKKNHKYFIYGGGYSDFSLIQVANEMGYPIIVNDVLLDDEISSDGINEKFREIEALARERGVVVVMAHPYPITIRMLGRWLPAAEKRGFNIAPVSLIIGKEIINGKKAANSKDAASGKKEADSKETTGGEVINKEKVEEN